MSSTSKENIIKAAQKLFGEKGFEGASLRDIAKKAKANVAMIAYYFGCKENLYRSCLSDFAQAQASVTKEILKSPKNLEDFRSQLQNLVSTLMQALDENTPLLRILLREMQSEHKNRELLQLTSPFFFSVRDYFQAAIDQKIVAKDRSPELLAMLFLGALTHPIHSEIPMKRLLNINIHDKDFQNNYSQHLIELFINGATL